MPNISFPFRCFLAVNFDQSVKEKISALQGRLKYGGDAVSWTNRDNFHLTIKFFGDVSSADYAGISDLIKKRAAAAAGSELELKGLGCFPETGPPKIVWAGCRDASGRLASLCDTLLDGFAALGFKKDRPFSPHITIGRVKRLYSSAAFIKKISDRREFFVDRVRVRQLDLMKSELFGSGPVYSVVESIALGVN